MSIENLESDALKLAECLIQAQNSKLEDQDKRIEDLEKRNDELHRLYQAASH